jgi:lipopolysaccharide biosynthesis protein
MNRDDIIRMAWKANLPSCHITHPKALERFAALVAAHERKECAKVCDALAVDPEYASQTTKLAAMAIRDKG